MINILIPMAGKSHYFSEENYPFPKPLIEIAGRTMIEHVIDNLRTASDAVNFIFVISADDVKKYRLDSTLKLITNGSCELIVLPSETKGSACSALMAINHINNKAPLLVANNDQIFDCQISDLLRDFERFDAGVVTFESVHPRWSYVRLDAQGGVIEAAEKNPLSKNAIAGIYYFAKGESFVVGAMKMIAKSESFNGSYFISPVINQLILDGMTITATHVSNNVYHTFYTPQKIKEYENLINRRG